MFAPWPRRSAVSPQQAATPPRLTFIRYSARARLSMRRCGTGRRLADASRADARGRYLPCVGKDGREFTIVKFRTMVPGAAGAGAGMWFEPDDPRITPAGRWLRATSIDELPQVWNVLRGDMSLVGPRPKPREIIDRYGSRYAETLRVRPGLTCLAAVEGRNTLRRALHRHLLRRRPAPRPRHGRGARPRNPGKPLLPRDRPSSGTRRRHG